MFRRAAVVFVCVAASLTGCSCDESLVDLNRPQPPSVPVVAIQPESPRTDDPLTVVMKEPSVDLGKRPVSYEYEWSRDDVKVEGQTTDRIDPALTRRGEHWRVSVIARAGPDVSGPATAEVVVVNTPPVIVALSLTPAPAVATAPLVASVTASDADDDAVSFAYAWRLNDDVDPAHKGPEIPPSSLAAGQRWTVTVTPHDGIEAGAAVTATALITGCGDGLLQEGEACDDGNAEALDRCTPACAVHCDNLNTGSDANGVAAKAGTADLHWVWWSESPKTDPRPATVSATCGGWAAPPSGTRAQWINRTGCATPSPGGSETYYSTTFWIEGPEAVAVLKDGTARVWFDNAITKVLLNGVDTGLTYDKSLQGYLGTGRPFFTWDASLFKTGLNTLTVVVLNAVPDQPTSINPDGLMLTVPASFGGGGDCAP